MIGRLDEALEGFFTEYCDAAYDLWNEVVSKGTPAKPDLWLWHQPWPWIKKHWADYVWKPTAAPVFAERELTTPRCLDHER